MHPAFSVIFFTTASGAGYGLITLMAIFQASGILPTDQGVGWTGFGISFGLITAGLLSSTVHLGHPERAWRAISQWRSSWLSREGLFAILTYIPAGAYAVGWIFFEWANEWFVLLGMIGAMLCMQTVYCTAMIYASLKTIRAWANSWTAICYLALSIMTGAVLLNAITLVFGYWHPALFWTASVAVAVSGIAKMQYWRFIDRNPSDSTTETAIGVKGNVRLLDSPHTQENYLQKEMGYRIARKHAAKLRQLAVAAAFVAPILLITLANTSAPATAAALAVLAVPVTAVGVLIERWLYFAEAKHVVTLYYGATTA